MDPNLPPIYGYYVSVLVSKLVLALLLLCFLYYVALKATYKARLKVLEGHRISSKSPPRDWDQT